MLRLEALMAEQKAVNARYEWTLVNIVTALGKIVKQVKEKVHARPDPQT